MTTHVAGVEGSPSYQPPPGGRLLHSRPPLTVSRREMEEKRTSENKLVQKDPPPKEVKWGHRGAEDGGRRQSTITAYFYDKTRKVDGGRDKISERRSGTESRLKIALISGDPSFLVSVRKCASSPHQFPPRQCSEPSRTRSGEVWGNPEPTIHAGSRQSPSPDPPWEGLTNYSPVVAIGCCGLGFSPRSSKSLGHVTLPPLGNSPCRQPSRTNPASRHW